MPPGSPVAILAPHLDDAVLSCWHVLESEPGARVVTLFAGVPPEGALGWWDRETGAADSAARMTERRREDAAVLAAAGCTAVQLDFLEDQYRDGSSVAVGDLLAAVEPHVRGATVYGPAGIGLHADHLLVRSVTTELAGSATGRRLYADLPYCARYGWPGWVSGDPPRRAADADWERALTAPDLTGLAPRAVRLDPGAQERKRSALAAYRTQFAALTVGADRHVADPEVLPFEVVWEPGGTSPSSEANRA